MIQDTDLPAALTTAVRSAAATLPAQRTDLPGVRAKARAYRRRRATLHAGVVVALVGLLGATVAALPELLRRPDPAARPAAGQRLVLQTPILPIQPAPDAIPEVRADGRVALLPLPVGLRERIRAVALPDGRLAIVGRPEAASRERLVILAPGGTVLVSRDIGAESDLAGTDLLAASNTEVYLGRRFSLVAHDIATGAEREVRVEIDGSVPRVYSAHATADRLVVAPVRSDPTCDCAVADRRTGRTVKVLRLPYETCSPFTPKLSPDGRLLGAMVTRVDGARQRGMLVVLEVSTGKVVREIKVSENPYPTFVRRDSWLFSGWAWTGARTVRIASGQTPLGGLDQLQDSLQVQTFTV